MKSKVAVFAILLTIATPKVSRADLFGGDVVVLGQILVNAIQQLAQLKSLLGSSQDTLSLIQNINQGINDSLALAQTINPNTDPGLYRDWLKAQEALKAIGQIYGLVTESKDAQIQRDADQSVAEAIALNNSIYKYTRDIDSVGQAIENASHVVSPGGAQKLTAQSMGAMLHVMNASLRAQATGLKLQAQTLAIQNRKDKEETHHILGISKNLKTAMKQQDPTFTLPRF